VDYPTDLSQFDEFFPNEDACKRYLEGLRWPNGFMCPKCGFVDEPWRMERGLLLCIDETYVGGEETGVSGRETTSNTTWTSSFSASTAGRRSRGASSSTASLKGRCSRATRQRTSCSREPDAGGAFGGRTQRGRRGHPIYLSLGRGVYCKDERPRRRRIVSKEELETAALSLPAEERASLAHALIVSIDDDPAAGLEEAWIREVDRRAEEVIRGEVELVPGDEVFRKAFARRRKK
jgi:putative addiction module component (TIGR02574 family)